MFRSLQLPLFAAVFAFGTLPSRKKDDSTPAGLRVQPHNQSALMTIMHNMMKDMGMMTPTNDLRLLTSNTDYNFAQLMVNHHSSAVKNSDLELKYGGENTPRRWRRTLSTSREWKSSSFRTGC